MRILRVGNRTWASVADSMCIRVEELHQFVDSPLCVRSGRDRDLVKECLKGDSFIVVGEKFGLSANRTRELFATFTLKLYYQVQLMMERVSSPSLESVLGDQCTNIPSSFVQRNREHALVGVMWAFCQNCLGPNAVWYRDALTAEQFVICCKKCYECRSKTGHMCPQYKRICTQLYGEEKTEELYK